MRGYQGATASMLSWWKRHGVTQGLVWFKGEIFYWIDLRIGHYFKAIIHFRYRRKKKVHRFTGFTEGNGERLLLKYYSMKCFTFWENIKTISILDSENYGFILNTIMSWHSETCGNKSGFSSYFLPSPIEPKFSQVCYFMLWYTKCWTWTILFTESV